MIMPDIDFQKIELNLIPKKGEQPVVFYASQYETARPFIAVLKWGDSEFAPGVDCYAEIDIRKNDDNLVVITDDVSIDNNEVSVILPVQAVTCIGKNLGQVKIYAADDNLIAALNFILEVQADPLAGGVTSETAIDNLTQQIEDITQQVIGDDYYNKAQTDALLADKADKSELPDMTDYYTKTQTDNLLNDKADRTDLATLASKAEVTQAISDEDTSLKNWVSSNFATPGYVATHYYTKLQVDDLLFGLMPVGSASGNPCSFDTEIAAALQSLTANIVCGGGGGTPSTPIPLVPHSELNLDVNGDTFTVAFGQTVYGGVYDAKRGKARITHGYCQVLSTDIVAEYLDTENGQFLARLTPSNPPKRTGSASIAGDVISNILTNKDQGSLYRETGNSVCIMGDADRFRLTFENCDTFEKMQTFLTNNETTLCYELATPIVIDVPSISVFAENGVNNIVSDCGGDVNVSYKDTIQHYIDERL